MRTTASLDGAYDAVVVGARVAGASTALLLARMGLRVLVIDRAREGKDTLSTHALMRGGVVQLERWGVLGGIRDDGTPCIRSTTFHYGDEAIRIPIKPRDGVDSLIAPKRTVLDRHLVASARAAGARVVYGTAAVELVLSPGGRVHGVVAAGPDGDPFRIEAGIVIGADGIRSRIAHLAGSPVVRSAHHAGGVVYGYWEGLEMEGSHWYYRPGGSAGAIPTNDGHTCVFVELPAERFAGMIPLGLDEILRRILAETSPELAERVAEGTLAGRLHPFPGVPGFLRRPWGPGWALVGDAGYFRDPITAHGITDALRDAESLARAVAAGDDRALMDYERERDEGAVGILEISDEIAGFAWDLDRVKEIHLGLSRLMSAESEALGGWGPLPTSIPRTPLGRPPVPFRPCPALT